MQKIRKLWYELEPMNDDHEKEMLEMPVIFRIKESNLWIFNLG